LSKYISREAIGKMKRIAGLVLLLALLFGCAPSKFCHSLKDASQFENDKYDCENMAYAKAHNFGAAGNPFIIIDETRRCLQLKHGWRKCDE
jgi:hypothetical protein